MGYRWGINNTTAFCADMMHEDLLVVIWVEVNLKREVIARCELDEKEGELLVHEIEKPGGDSWVVSNLIRTRWSIWENGYLRSTSDPTLKSSPKPSHPPYSIHLYSPTFVSTMITLERNVAGRINWRVMNWMAQFIIGGKRLRSSRSTMPLPFWVTYNLIICVFHSFGNLIPFNH